MSQFHGPLPAMGDLSHAMQEGISTHQASKREADCAGYPGGWSGPILSVGWGQGTREKDVPPHLCSSTSPQSVRPRTTPVCGLYGVSKHAWGSRTHFLRIPGSVAFCWKNISETASGIYGS